MREQLKFICDTNKWTLVERPQGNSVTPEKKFLKIETKDDGSLEKYKAGYVDKALEQLGSFVFFEPIGLTGKPETFRLIFSLAAKDNLKLKQKEVKSAHLHPDIKEEMYREQPMCFKKCNSFGKEKVCRLRKSFYGLKRAVRNWYEELAVFLIKQNVVRSSYDYCLFSKNEIEIDFFVLS